jgi:cytochrome oxidase Cu insertion factor (SCO1/SenC/PrrC family)
MQRRFVLLAIVFFSMFFLLSNVRVVHAQFSEAGVQKLRVAVDAPDFTLKEIGGGKVSLKEQRGKIILLNFFATW